jgi:acetyl-CoA carboxylase biotin carboxyl carrier protein
MDLQQIKTFIDAMASSDLAEMEVSHDGWTLRLVRRAATAAAAPRIAGAERPPASSGALPDPVAPLVDDVRAPLYGVVHLQPSPGEPPFVAAGANVRAGQTLCVIEAMKVFNEVRAERDGMIAAVLVTSGQEVEADQPLLRFA